VGSNLIDPLKSVWRFATTKSSAAEIESVLIIIGYDLCASLVAELAYLTSIKQSIGHWILCLG